MLRLPSRAILDLRKTICAATLLAMVCTHVPAWAGKILDLSIGSGGVVTYADAGAKPGLSGQRISVGGMTYGANTPSILMGQLIFTGGRFDGTIGSNWFWGPGGNLSIQGCADLDHDGRCEKGDFRGILLTGSFLNARLVEQNGKEILEAQIVDRLNPQLAAFLNLPNMSYTGELELVLANGRNVDGRWLLHDRVLGGFLNDNSLTVPEPSSILLLGASLTGLWVLLLRRYFKPGVSDALPANKNRRLWDGWRPDDGK